MLVVKAVSLVPLELIRTIPFVVAELKVSKIPPTTIFPSGCIAKDCTLAPISKPVPVLVVKVVSLVPSGFNRTIPFTVVPLKVVKVPTTTILPSDCIATEFTVLSKPVPVLVVKVVSLVPSELRRTISFTVTPSKV